MERKKNNNRDRWDDCEVFLPLGIYSLLGFQNQSSTRIIPPSSLSFFFFFTSQQKPRKRKKEKPDHQCGLLH
jgi:hypothetical protein